MLIQTAHVTKREDYSTATPSFALKRVEDREGKAWATTNGNEHPSQIRVRRQFHGKEDVGAKMGDGSRPRDGRDSVMARWTFPPFWLDAPRLTPNWTESPPGRAQRMRSESRRVSGKLP